MEDCKIIHRVERGETLKDIAQIYKIPSGIIAGYNEITSGIHTGQRLVIPKIEGKVYRVKPGDTAESIAIKFNITAEELLAQNKAELIYPFMELIIGN